MVREAGQAPGDQDGAEGAQAEPGLGVSRHASKTSAETAAAFRASYHHPQRASRRGKYSMAVRPTPSLDAPTIDARGDRWARFRIDLLVACCRKAPLAVATLLERLDLPLEIQGRMTPTVAIAARNIASMLTDGFIEWAGCGFKITARGRRLLVDLRALDRDDRSKT